VMRGATIAGHAFHAMAPVITVIADQFKIFFHLLDAGFDLLGGIIDIFTGNWTAAGQRFHAVTNNIRDAFKDMWNQVQVIFGAALEFFRTIPGKIGGALSSLASMLYNVGRNAILGLWHGAESIFGGLLKTAESWGHSIANAIGSPFGIHFSEPSEATQMVKAGQQAGRGFMKGLASTGLGGLGGLGAVSVPAAAGGGIHLTLEIAGTGNANFDAFMLQFIRNQVRIKGGGSVQAAFGKAGM
jgi:phage-related protein